MTYSKPHQKFSNHLNKPEALTNPQDFLGPNYQTVLNFWWFMDSLTKDQTNEVARRYSALDSAAGNAAKLAARDAAWGAVRNDAAWDVARVAAWAAWAAARDAAAGAAKPWVAACDAAWVATYELIGMHKLLNDGKTLMFVPLFNDL